MKTLSAILVASAAFLSFTAQASASDDCRELSLGRSDKPIELGSEESEGLVRQWISGVLPATLKFKFVDKKIDKPCFFTEDGWTEFKDKFNVSEYEKGVKDEQTVNQAVLEQPPVIKARGVMADGKYGYVVIATLVPWAESTSSIKMGRPFRAEYILKQAHGSNGDNSLRVVSVR